ncbi:MAG: hypothetical protein PHQ23_15935 [Candidatus Wallbacteria bacterium]|nr:hypothetical protein [Candidatus Wallbacteria bacterium]
MACKRKSGPQFALYLIPDYNLSMGSVFRIIFVVLVFICLRPCDCRPSWIDQVMDQLRLQDYQKAFVLLNTVADSSSDEYHALLGVVYEYMEDFVRAADNYRLIVADEKSQYYWFALYRLIVCHDMLEEYDQVRALSTDWLKQYEGSPEAVELKKRLQEIG